MAKPSTRDQVLAAARQLFTTKGFANASVSELCREAGITPPTLYYHFGSKDDLFEAVVDDTLSLDSFQQLLTEAVAGPSDAQGKLRAFVLTYLTHFPTELLNPGLHLHDSTQLSDISLRRIQTGIAAVYEVTRELLEGGVKSGEFRQVDVDRAAACLMGSVDSFVRSKVYLGIDYDPEEVTEGVVDLFTRGLAHTAPGDDPNSR